MQKRSTVIRLTEWILRYFMDRESLFSVTEDLETRFKQHIKHKGIIYASLAYLYVFFLVLFSFFAESFKWSIIMSRNYLKISLRNIRKYKAYSFINITGLAIGMAVCILIMLWVHDELNYDRFHENINNLYRIYWKQEYSGQTIYIRSTPGPLAAALKNEFPEVKKASRFLSLRSTTIYYDDKKFIEYGLAFIDPDFLDMFSFKVIRGEKSVLLRDAYTMLITQKTAKKYFGDENPLGKILKIDNKHSFTVTGVLENIPVNSSIQFDFLIPFENTGRVINEDFTSWFSNWPHTYFQLQDFTDYLKFQSKIKDRIKQEREGISVTLFAQPVKKIHLFTLTGKPAGMKYVYIFSIVAFCVLLIACINFMNLATARSGGRAREVAIRKVVGANRKNIASQFFGESILLSVIALIISLVLIILCLPLFNNISGKEMSLGMLKNRILVLLVIITGFVTGIISGSYPALFLSAFQPVKILKGVFKVSSKNSNLRKILVVTQFSLSILLIISTLIVGSQLNYVRGKDLGYNKDNLLYMVLRGDSSERYKVLKSELTANFYIKNVTTTSRLPLSGGDSNGGWEWEGKDPEQSVMFNNVLTDINYLKTMGMEIISGNNFKKEISDIETENIDFILNEEAVRRMDIKNPVGKKLSRGNSKGKIIGIVKDFHFASLKREIEPMVIWPCPSEAGYIIVRLEDKNTSETVSYIESVWKRINPDIPFSYQFLDTQLKSLYSTDYRIQNIFNYFAGLAIFIACIGLFGLSSFMAEQRKKEIGIRKVLGASIPNILGIMSKEFMILVVAANILSWPIAYYYMKNWLQNFVYKTNIAPLIFFCSGLAALLLTLLTISFQSLKAARTNPVDSIRIE